MVKFREALNIVVTVSTSLSSPTTFGLGAGGLISSTKVMVDRNYWSIWKKKCPPLHISWSLPASQSALSLPENTSGCFSAKWTASWTSLWTESVGLLLLHPSCLVPLWQQDWQCTGTSWSQYPCHKRFDVGVWSVPELLTPNQVLNHCIHVVQNVGLHRVQNALPPSRTFKSTLACQDRLHGTKRVHIANIVSS